MTRRKARARRCRDGGFTAVWFMGLWIILLGFVGGLGLMLWQVVDARQELQGVADAAAIAGAAGGIDTMSLRSSGEVRLNERAARRAASAVLAANGTRGDVAVLDGTRVRVRVTRSIAPTLLGLLGAKTSLTLDVQAIGDPVQSP